MGVLMSGDNSRFLPPWRERNPDGSLGSEYGPTAGSYLRQCAEFKDWAFRRHGRGVQGADRLRAFMRLPDGSLREGVPDGECGAYLLVVEDGLSLKEAASHAGVKKSTIKSYLRRLRARAKAERVRVA